MILTQILLSTIIIFIIYKTYSIYVKEKLSFVFISFWMLLWISALYFVLNPNLLIEIANEIGIGRGVDLAIYLSILLLFYLAYKILVKLEKINRDITKMVRNSALRKREDSYDKIVK